jgi:cell division protein FtsB
VARRKKNKTSILAPAGNLIRRLSDTNVQVRRRLVRYSLWCIGLFLLYSFMSGTYGIPRIIRLELEKRALIEDNRLTAVALVDADRVRTMLRSDKTFIEYVARTRYHLTKPDEIVYRYRGQ